MTMKICDFLFFYINDILFMLGEISMKKRKEMSKNIPDEIKVLFGKHLVFSIIL